MLWQPAANSDPFRRRLRSVLLLCAAFALLLGALWANHTTRAQLQTLRVAVIERLQPTPPPEPLTEEAIAAELASLRHNLRLSPLLLDEKLRTGARVMAALILDRQTTQLDQDDMALLQQLDVRENTAIATFAVFVPDGAPVDFHRLFASFDAATASAETRIGIGLLPGVLDRTRGQALVLIVQSPLTRKASTKPVTILQASPPNYTSDELWQAVQQYRDSHHLFAFNKNNDLCTLAQTRADELAAAKALDAHAGFRSRIDAFFADHPGWTNVNENLASGYETATQAVEWGWDKSQGHQALLKSIDYPEACARVKDGFAVLITGRK